MSSQKKYRKGYGNHPGSTPHDHFVLRVLQMAEQAGRKAGRKTVKRALKDPRVAKPDITAQQLEDIYAATERAGAASAVQTARKMLTKSRKQAERIYRDKRQLPGHEQAPTQLGASAATPLQGRGQHVLTVKRTEKLSQEMLRVIAGAKNLAGFLPNGQADQYVKVFFADPELGLIPPYDIKSLRQRLPREQVPRSRSYTIRWLDEAAGELAIDFVLHGERGSGGAWAAQVQPGDPLVISAARGKYTPGSHCEFYIFAADEAGIPAIASALGRLPSSALGVALLEVADVHGQFPIECPDGVELRWLHRDGRPAGTTDLLPEAVAQLETPPSGAAVMAHAERSAVKSLARIVNGWGLDKSNVSISSYWTLRRGKGGH